MSEQKYVYFVRPVGMDGPIKIGCSAEPAKRLTVLAAWSPFPLELIGTVPGTFDDENHLHRRFSDLHTRKEWFMSSPLLRQTIDSVLSGIPIKDACKDLQLKKPLRNQKRPSMTADCRLFIEYGHRIRKAHRSLRAKDGRWSEPDDVRAIMHNWRCDRIHGHLPIIPTVEQFARLEQYLADPKVHGTFKHWTHYEPKAEVVAA